MLPPGFDLHRYTGPFIPNEEEWYTLRHIPTDISVVTRLEDVDKAFESLQMLVCVEATLEPFKES